MTDTGPVLVIALRQAWTVRMGMRGVVISDCWQGIVAYLGGGLPHAAEERQRIDALFAVIEGRKQAGEGAEPGPQSRPIPG